MSGEGAEAIPDEGVANLSASDDEGVESGPDSSPKAVVSSADSSWGGSAQRGRAYPVIIDSKELEEIKVMTKTVLSGVYAVLNHHH